MGARSAAWCGQVCGRSLRSFRWLALEGHRRARPTWPPHPEGVNHGTGALRVPRGASHGSDEPGARRCATARYGRLGRDAMRSSATSGPGNGRAASRPTRLPSSRAGPAFELSESKLHPPRVGDQTVVRAELVDKLRRATRRLIVVVCAGPGYGKTTALAQWAASDTDRRFAWVSIDRHDNDP